MATNGYWSQAWEDTQTELTVLAEWLHIQQHLLTFPLPPSSQGTSSWRSMLETGIAQITQQRARIHWKQSTDALSETFDRWYNIGWGKRRYGLLGLAPGYLASFLFPTIPQSLAQLCGIVLALIEYKTFIGEQIQQLPPLLTIERLTPRERDILQGLAHGESEQETDQRLGITPATIRSHRQRLYQRLEVHNSQEAVLRAFVLGLLNWLDFPSQGADR